MENRGAGMRAVGRRVENGQNIWTDWETRCSSLAGSASGDGRFIGTVLLLIFVELVLRTALLSWAVPERLELVIRRAS